MRLSSRASAAALNLAFGVFLTFLAPAFSQQIGIATVIAYLLALAIHALRQNAQLLGLISIAAAGATFTVSNESLHWVICGWAALVAITLFRSRNLGAIFAQRLDQRLVAAFASVLFLAQTIPVLDSRAVLGFFAAYLLVTGVFMGIGAASQSK